MLTPAKTKEAGHKNRIYDSSHRRLAPPHLPGAGIFFQINWIWLTVFVGANLLQSDITKWCLMEKILAKLGVEK